MCGVATNVCVETTARDGYMYDYYVTMIDDCSAAYEPKLHHGHLGKYPAPFRSGGLVTGNHRLLARPAGETGGGALARERDVKGL